MELENIPNDARLIEALFSLCAGGAGNIFGNKSIYSEPKAMIKLSHENANPESAASNRQAGINRASE